MIRAIVAGYDWREEMYDNLERQSDVMLLLLKSLDFIGRRIIFTLGRSTK